MLVRDPFMAMRMGVTRTRGYVIGMGMLNDVRRAYARVGVRWEHACDHARAAPSGEARRPAPLERPPPRVQA